VSNRPALFTGSGEGIWSWEIIVDRPLPRLLPPYRSDAAAAADELDRTDDAAAVAELVTARTATPPLAVGLFGDWGEGKSHFLNLLQQEVEVAARPDNPLSHTAVRHVRFNAWHYAETDLWASLVAELFAQLATPADGDVASEQRRQSRLTAELVTERGLRERLRAGGTHKRPVPPASSQGVQAFAVLGWCASGRPGRGRAMVGVRKAGGGRRGGRVAHRGDRDGAWLGGRTGEEAVF